MNGHNNPPARGRFDHLMKGVLGFPKRPQLPEAELYCRRNAASATIVQIGGLQKFTISTKKKAQLDPVGIPQLQEGVE